jgi:propanol-preferring alcohol dehydrogenase
LGVEAYVDVSTVDDVVGAVEKITAGGASAVLVTTPARDAYQSALGMLAPLGTLVCVGIPGVEGRFDVHPIDFIARGVKIVGSAVGTRRDILDAVDFVRRGVVKPKVEVVKLENLTEICAKFANGTVSQAKPGVFPSFSLDLILMFVPGDGEVRCSVLKTFCNLEWSSCPRHQG